MSLSQKHFHYLNVKIRIVRLEHKYETKQKCGAKTREKRFQNEEQRVCFDA